MKATLVILGVLAASGPAVASWTSIPLVQLVDKTPIIVAGKITRIEPGSPSTNLNDRLYDTAYIVVSQVLKNAHTNQKIGVSAELPMPNLSPRNKHRSSIDFRYKVGTEGVWFLYSAEGMFGNAHPSGHQSLDKLPEVLDLLSDLPKAKALLRTFTEGHDFAPSSDLDPVIIVKAHLLVNGPHWIDYDAATLIGASTERGTTDYLVRVPWRKGNQKIFVVNLTDRFVGELKDRKANQGIQAIK